MRRWFPLPFWVPISMQPMSACFSLLWALSLLPKLGYRAVPLGKNWSYGIAAAIFAAIAYKELLEKETEAAQG